MEHRNGQQSSLLIEALLSKPRSYSILKTLEILSSFSENEPSSNTRDSVLKEQVLFRANPSFGFPSSDVSEISPHASGRFEVAVNFMGLYGPASPLPDHFTQSIIDEAVEIEKTELRTFYISSLKELKSYQEKSLDVGRLKEKVASDKQIISSGALKKILFSPAQLKAFYDHHPVDSVLTETQLSDLINKRGLVEINHEPSANLRDFLDVFNHRLISLYLQASNKYHPYRNLSKQKDHIPNILYSLMGAPDKLERSRSPIQWHKLLPFAGLISLKQGAAEVICKVIAGYFGFQKTDVYIEEHISRWVAIPSDQLSKLGRQSATMGYDLVLGKSVFDVESKFRLHIKNLLLGEFQRFLPRNHHEHIGTVSHYDELSALLDFLRSPEMRADICLHVNPKEPVGMKLTQTHSTKLGQSSWLKPTHNSPREVVV